MKEPSKKAPKQNKNVAYYKNKKKKTKTTKPRVSKPKA